nr:integrase, catalytic region, zinc finger, CCHC-type, peptidase aspartic, catalytic [Tanacetum cinerariifolium]
MAQSDHNIFQADDCDAFDSDIDDEPTAQTIFMANLSSAVSSLPQADIYKLINHNTEAKAIWDNVKMLLAGSKLTKEDRESQLMVMPNIQLNSKFVSNMTPEWDRFVTAVKLNKGLKETNHEQLYAYLKQHEKHVAYDRLIYNRFNPTTNDPLALVSHVQPQL